MAPSAWLRLVLAALALSSAATLARAEDLPITAFYGRYQGSAVARTEDSRHIGFDVRDLDVTMAAKGGGFEVAWTTVIRPPANAPSAQPQRRAETLLFEPTGEPGLFRASAPADALRGEPLSWARIEGRTLTIYVMNINRRGLYEMLSYARTLTADGNLQLLFTRIRDGERVRKVTATLKRVK